MPIRAPISHEVIAEIRTRYLRGDKIENIEFDLRVSQHSVQEATADLPRRQPKEEQLRLNAIYLASLCVHPREIATRLACPLRAVLRALAPAYVPPKAPSSETIEAARLAINARQRANAAKRRRERDFVNGTGWWAAP